MSPNEQQPHWYPYREAVYNKTPEERVFVETVIARAMDLPPDAWSKSKDYHKGEWGGGLYEAMTLGGVKIAVETYCLGTGGGYCHNYILYADDHWAGIYMETRKEGTLNLREGYSGIQFLLLQVSKEIYKREAQIQEKVRAVERLKAEAIVERERQHREDTLRKL